jgi:hypothetical protein
LISTLKKSESCVRVSVDHSKTLDGKVPMRVLRVIAKFMFSAHTEPRLFTIWGVVILVCLSVFLTQHQFTIAYDGHHRMITQDGAPLVYWSISIALAAAGATFFGYGVYFMRRRR